MQPIWTRTNTAISYVLAIVIRSCLIPADQAARFIHVLNAIKGLFPYLVNISPDQMGTEWCKIVRVASELYSLPIMVADAILRTSW